MFFPPINCRPPLNRIITNNDVVDNIGTAYPTACTWIGVAIYLNNDSIVDIVIVDGTLVDGDRTLINSNGTLVDG